MNLPMMEEVEALLMVALITDALSVLMVTNDGHIPTEIDRGAILLADELLRRVWPLINADELGPQAQQLRTTVGMCAASVRREYRLVGIQ